MSMLLQHLKNAVFNYLKSKFLLFYYYDFIMVGMDRVD